MLSSFDIASGVAVSDETERLRQLLELPRESDCVEFKVNNFSPETIGENISALANAAALLGANAGYIVWGVEDESHAVVGTTFAPQTMRQGNEPLQGWLARNLRPSVDFRIHEVIFQEKHVVYFEIPSASHTPVRFKEFEFIRVGATTRRLRDYPEKERKLWESFGGAEFETRDAKTFGSAAEAVSSLDFDAYLTLSGKQKSTTITTLVDQLRNEGFIRQVDAGGWAVTNFGALLLAKTLDVFPSVRRKAARVIIYKTADRSEAIHDYEGRKGYAAGFEALIRFLQERLPKNELFLEALRTEAPLFPHLALRELVANALIHQDLWQTGAGPMIEVFPDRIEISNPGICLVEVQRMIDAPPRSRNEHTATFMRRVGICEERGSGIDRVVMQCETFQLPAPDFAVVEGFTRATLYAPRPLRSMSKAERVRACYQHAVLQWISNSQMTNASVRKRFGIKESSAAQASRIIREALESGTIKEFDPENQSNKHNKYVPYWA